nr:hypothetical protein [Tanacetum cinerariifolium]
SRSELQFDFTYLPPRWGIDPGIILPGRTIATTSSPNVPAGVSSKGKSPMVEEDILVKVRTFRQMEEDRLAAATSFGAAAGEVEAFNRTKAFVI